MHRAVIDHRSQEFSRLGSEVLENLRPIFQTKGPVIIYPVLRHRRMGSRDRQHSLPG